MKLRSRLLAGCISFFPLSLGAVLTLSSSGYAQPVTGPYVSAAAGASFNQDQVVRLSRWFPGGRDTFDTGVATVSSLGWGLGNGFRVEIEGNYRNIGLRHFKNDSFPSDADGRQQNYGFMANALFDMDIGQNWLYPYFGAGIGYAWSTLNSRITAPNNHYTQVTGGTYGAFAYQAMFGLSFPIPWVVGLSATTEYRFWTMLGPQSHTASSWGVVGGGVVGDPKPYSYARGNRSTTTNFNHSLMLGLRYELDPAPPPLKVTAPVSPAPVVVPARSYLVFFDWDKATLSDRARAIVAEAAQASHYTQTTRIEVNGHTDSSHAPGPRGEAYNMNLSLRRANSVKAELVRSGVDAASIDIHGFGDTKPLVQTSSNAREPQNRRVEIILR